MTDSRFVVRRGFRIEELGEETIVFDRSSGRSIHRVSGDGAAALRLIAAGAAETELHARLLPAVEELVAAGIVADSSQWSRRKMLATGGKGLAAAGVVWTTATVTTFALADPAAAATPCSSPGPTTPANQKFTASGTYITGRGVTSLKVRVWGGGGGGGGGRYDGTWSSGSGGGGGAYAYTQTLTVTPCTAYSFVVGDGGGGGVKRTDGSPGADSYFATTGTIMAKGGAKGIGANGGNPSGGAGGAAGSSVGSSRMSGGAGGQGGGNVGQNTGGGGGGGASNGGNGSNGGDHNGNGGAGGAAGGVVAGGNGGGDSGAGEAPGGGGGGGHGEVGGFFQDRSTTGGAGARGQVWVGY